MMKKATIIVSSLLLSSIFIQAQAENTCMPLSELYGQSASEVCKQSCGNNQTECYFDPIDKSKSVYSDSSCNSKCTLPESKED